MDSFESLLKAAQQIDSPNFNVKVVVELKQAEASTPPRPAASSAIATMPPPPSPPRVQLAEHYDPVASSGVLSMPSLYSPCRAPAPTLQYYNNYYVAPAPAAEQSSPGSLYAPPTSALAAMMISSPSSAPSSSWPYYDLMPRFSGGYHPHPVVGNHSPAARAQPFCLFPAATTSSAQAHHASPQASQGLTNHTAAAAAAMAAAPTAPSDGFFRPIAEHPRSATNKSAFVSPEPKKTRTRTQHQAKRGNYSSCVSTAAATSSGFLELKPSAEDDAPPVEEDTADTKMRIVVTPDAEVNNNDDDVDDEDIATYDESACPVDESTTLPALFDEEDIPYVNPAHYIIVTEILEPFVVPEYHEDASAAVAAAAASASASTRTSFSAVYKKSAKKARSRRPLPTRRPKAMKDEINKPNFRAGSVAFRCRFCKHSRRKDQYALATIYPQKIEGLYRANLRFQSDHLTVCRECPREIQERLKKARKSNDHRSYKVKNGGVRKYWIETAVRKGFRECKRGIGFVAQD